MNSSVIVKKSKKEKFKCSYSDSNEYIGEDNSVHSTGVEKNETIFKSDSNMAQTKKESISESEMFYARECV